MTRILTITNQKGGVGKTTTTINLASALKHKGYKVLIIDMDPQGNLSFCANAETVLSATIYEVLKGEVKLQHAIQRTAIIDIVAANILLSGIEMEYTQSGREFLLRNALQNIRPHYDYILIDTPPGLGILTINAMSACNGILIPMVADIFSLQGITQLHETVLQVRKYSNPNCAIEGVILNKYNERVYLNREVKGTAELVLNDLKLKLFDTSIRSSIKVAEAQSSQQDLFDLIKQGDVAQDYLDLVEEILQGETHVQ